MILTVYLFFFLSSLLISLWVTGRSIEWASVYGFLDAPGERKVHTSTKPRLGGLGVFAGFWIPTITAVAGIVLLPSEITLGWFGDLVNEHKAGVIHRLPMFCGLLIGGIIIFMGGLLDDRYSLSPKVKLGWQFVASLILILSGFRLDFYRSFWDSSVGLILFGIPVTLLWMLFLMNAFNLLDNMDGLSAGVAGITTAFFAIYAHFQGEIFLPCAMCALIGALLGFLHYNWHPSRIFMGDGGALLMGYLISAFTCRCTYYHSSPYSILEWFLNPFEIRAGQGLLSLLTPLVIMAVPIFDTVSVIVIRLKYKKPIMQGDTNHFSHRLVALGLSQKRAVQVIYLVTIFTGLGALILRTAAPAQAILVFFQVLTVFGLITVLEREGRKAKKKATGEINSPGGCG